MKFQDKRLQLLLNPKVLEALAAAGLPPVMAAIQTGIEVQLREDKTVLKVRVK